MPCSEVVIFPLAFTYHYVLITSLEQLDLKLDSTEYSFGDAPEVFSKSM